MARGMDCAETRALVSVLVRNEDRACFELRSLRPMERRALAAACRRLADLAEDPELDKLRLAP